MTWAVVIVACYIGHDCRVIPLGRDFESRASCKVRAELSEYLYQNADFVSAECSRQYRA